MDCTVLLCKNGPLRSIWFPWYTLRVADLLQSIRADSLCVSRYITALILYICGNNNNNKTKLQCVPHKLARQWPQHICLENGLTITFHKITTLYQLHWYWTTVHSSTTIDSLLRSVVIINRLNTLMCFFKIKIIFFK